MPKGLASTKQTLYQRFMEPYASVPGYESSVWGKCLKLFAHVMSKIGITFPVLYLIPNTQRQSFARQGYLCLGPGESASWVVTASVMGVVVLRKIHIMPLDCVSTNELKFTFGVLQPDGGGVQNLSTIADEDGTYNDPTKPDCAPGEEFIPTESAVVCEAGSVGALTEIECPDVVVTGRHPGLRKPLVMVLDEQEKTTLILSNTSVKFPAFVEFELQGWYA